MKRIEFMDRYGIQAQALSVSDPGVGSNNLTSIPSIVAGLIAELPRLPAEHN